MTKEKMIHSVLQYVVPFNRDSVRSIIESYLADNEPEVKTTSLATNEVISEMIKNHPCIDPLFGIKGCDMPKGSCDACKY